MMWFNCSLGVDPTMPEKSTSECLPVKGAYASLGYFHRPMSFSFLRSPGTEIPPA
jgi:hypothetical protein